MKCYAGIGSRQTPPDVLALMTKIAVRLEGSGLVLRSGGALGADSAFSAGAIGYKAIYLPWEGFNGHKHGAGGGVVCGSQEDLQEIAKKHHPCWYSLNYAVRKLHTRNVAQILGSVNPGECKSLFVVCWTPGGKGGGGTGQALRVAKAYDVPIHDLGKPDVLARAREVYG